MHLHSQMGLIHVSQVVIYAIILDDTTKTLFLVECKSTNGTSIPLTMIKENQIESFKNASTHTLVAGLFANFRNKKMIQFYFYG